MSKCIQICTVEDLGLASDYPGYMRRYNDQLWFSDGSTWMEISGKREEVIYPLHGSDIIFIANKNFVITELEFLYPVNPAYAVIFVNDELYVTGNPIYYGDRVKIICDEGNTLRIVKEYFDIPTLNLQATINYNFPFNYSSGMTYMMVVGVKNV